MIEDVREIKVPVDDGHTVEVVGMFFDGRLDGLNLFLQPPDDGRVHGERQHVSIAELEIMGAVVRPVVSMLPPDARERLAQPEPDDNRAEEIHRGIARVCMPVCTVIRELSAHNARPPIGEAVSVLCRTAADARSRKGSRGRTRGS